LAHHSSAGRAARERLQEDPKLLEESFQTLLKLRENRGEKPKTNSKVKLP
jgi:hypothetical protein